MGVAALGAAAKAGVHAGGAMTNAASNEAVTFLGTTYSCSLRNMIGPPPTGNCESEHRTEASLRRDLGQIKGGLFQVGFVKIKTALISGVPSGKSGNAVEKA